MSLRHLHLPPALAAGHIPRLIRYARAVDVQAEFQRDLLDWKAGRASAPTTTPASPPPPSPALLTFTPAPTYTLGRRQTAAALSSDDEARLRRPLAASVPGASFVPAVVEAPRGGLATYHGPGQLVAWPVVDLHSPLHVRRLTVREYACLLEKTTIAALARFGLEARTRPGEPGVWVYGPRGGAASVSAPPAASSSSSDSTACSLSTPPLAAAGKPRKIAALGVHLRRHVTGLGVAINVDMPVGAAGSPSSASTTGDNPWARIDPCGLGEGVDGVTSLAAELGDSADVDASSLADVWAAEFAGRLQLGEGRPGQGAESPDDQAKKLVSQMSEEVGWEALRRRLRLDDPEGYTNATMQPVSE